MRVCKAAVCGVVMSFFLAPAIEAQNPADSRDAWAILKTGTTAANKSDHIAAIRALGLVENDAAAKELALKALTDQAPEVRTAAEFALGGMKAQDAAGRIFAVVKSDPDVGVVLAGARALIELGDERVFEIYYAVLTGQMKSGQSLMEQQQRMLHDPKKMAQFGFETGISFVPFAGLGWGAYKMISKDDVSPVRAAAAAVLAKDPDPKSERGLESVLFDKSWLVRLAAVTALAQRNDPSALPKLVPLLTDAKPAVRYATAATIVRLSKPGVASAKS
jgi:HEAT repeat protein